MLKALRKHVPLLREIDRLRAELRDANRQVRDEQADYYRLLDEHKKTRASIARMIERASGDRPAIEAWPRGTRDYEILNFYITLLLRRIDTANADLNPEKEHTR